MRPGLDEWWSKGAGERCWVNLCVCRWWKLSSGTGMRAGANAGRRIWSGKGWAFVSGQHGAGVRLEEGREGRGGGRLSNVLASSGASPNNQEMKRDKYERLTSEDSKSLVLQRIPDKADACWMGRGK